MPFGTSLYPNTTDLTKEFLISQQSKSSNIKKMSRMMSSGDRKVVEDNFEYFLVGGMGKSTLIQIKDSFG